MTFIQEWWVQIIFLLGILGTLIKFIQSMIQATKCSLRNQILSIYDRCKDKQEITRWQLESLLMSAEMYFKLKGNSFIVDIVEIVKTFKVID